MKTKQIITEISAIYKWKAQDKGGFWYVYKTKPKLGETVWYIDGPYWRLIGEGNPNPNWKDTLEKIYEVELVEE